MISDTNKAITHISYNHLNLPVEIIFGTYGKIAYLYNATGNKLKKTVTEGTTITTTDYLTSFQYKNSKLQFFSHAEGYVNATEEMVLMGGTSYRFNYVFNYTDHLGNIRLSYSLDPSTKVLKIIEENHYYPFGLKHSGYNSDKMMYTKEAEVLKIKPVPPLFITSYKYKYNGKEYQDELGLNMYDYGARNYDPALGRWMNIDPLAEKFFDDTPYNYALNNPVFFLDPDGMDVEDFSWGTRYTGTDAQDFIRNLQSQMTESSEKSEEEPPISFFDKTYTKIYSKKDVTTEGELEDYYNTILNGLVNSRDFKTGDGIFSFYGHGVESNGVYGIADQRNGKENQKDIFNVKEFNELLKAVNPQYAKAMEEGKPITLYLLACNSGNGEKNSFASRFSVAFKNVTVIAPDGKMYYSRQGNSYSVSSIENNGSLVTYKNGGIVKTQKYSEFKKQNNPTVAPSN